MSARVLAFSVLAGCGRLADGDYVGEPLYALNGKVLDGGSDTALQALQLRVALFWAHDGARGEDQAGIVTTRFPAEYTLELYHYPPEEALFEARWDSGRRHAIGMPLVYADLNGDGRWNEGFEDLVGGALTQLVLFADGDGGLVTSPDGSLHLITEGFSRVSSGIASFCETESAGLPSAVDTETMDLSVGVGWFQGLVDVDCDGDSDEWIDACPSEEELQRMCSTGEVDPGQPCIDRCGDPSFDDAP